MRDIVRAPRKQLTPEVSTPFHPPVNLPPTQGASLWVERILDAGSDAGTWIQSILQPKAKPATIVQPPRIISTTSSIQIPKVKTATKVKTAAHKATGKAKHFTKTTIHHAKTPLGKVALVNAAAILALSGYVASTRSHPVFLAKDLGQTLAQSQLRSYLPNPQSATTQGSQPFSEQLASVPNQRLSLLSWATPWNLDELKQHADSYTAISAFWATLGTDGQTVTPKADWSAWTNFRSSAPLDGKQLWLTISANPNNSYKALASADVRDHQIANLLQATEAHGFTGIDIDYEALGSENRDLFTDFIRAVATSFHAHNKQVAVTVEARIANQVPMDWHSLGALADQLRVMAYDYHSQTTPEPGPVAPLGWIKEICDYAISQIPSSKLVIGLGDYGYDWVEDPATNTYHGVGVSYDQATAIAQQRKITPIEASGLDSRGYDIGKSQVLVYLDDSGRRHSAWYEDSNSLQMKLNLVSQYQPAGVIFWNVGLGDKKFWDQQSNT